VGESILSGWRCIAMDTSEHLEILVSSYISHFQP
jgi:hypothetical protein